MSAEGQSKREILKEKVIALVKEFVETEGGISPLDLEYLFGDFGVTQVSATLGEMLMSFPGSFDQKA